MLGSKFGNGKWQATGDSSPTYKHRVIMSKSIDKLPCLTTTFTRPHY